MEPRVSESNSTTGLPLREENEESLSSRTCVVLLAVIAITLVAVWLRFWNISATFESSDQAAMAYLVRHSFGFRWILAHDYGPVLPVIHLVVAGFCRLASWPMGEAVARLPMAIIGLAQVPVTFALMRRLGRPRVEGLLAAAVCAVLPPLVTDSHYPWGMHGVWLLAGSIALWAVLAWLDERRPWQCAVAGVALFAHCLSSAYAFALPVAILFALGKSFRDGRPDQSRARKSCPHQSRARLPLTSPNDVKGKEAVLPYPKNRSLTVAALTKNHSLTVAALNGSRMSALMLSFFLPCILAFAVILLSWRWTGAGQLGHLLRKSGQNNAFGLHTGQIAQLPAVWASQLGTVAGLLGAAGLAVGFIWWWQGRRIGLLAVWAWGALIPFTLLADWGSTGYACYYLFEVVYAAALLGVVALAAVWRMWPRARAGTAILATAGMVQLSLGSADVVLPGLDLRPLTAIRTGWGNVHPDGGAKAAGYYVREHVPGDAVILALHDRQGMEVTVAEYYLGRKVLAGYDLPPAVVGPLWAGIAHRVDVVIADATYRVLLPEDGEFEPVCIVRREGRPVRFVYARRHLNLPVLDTEAGPLNARYDARYRPTRIPMALPAPEGFEVILAEYQQTARRLRTGNAIRATTVRERLARSPLPDSRGSACETADSPAATACPPQPGDGLYETAPSPSESGRTTS